MKQKFYPGKISQSDPVNRNTEGVEESVRINGVFV